MGELDNLSGRVFGIWKVLEFDHTEWYGDSRKHGATYYRCECTKCGRIFFLRSRPQLIQRKNWYHRGKCEEE